MKRLVAAVLGFVVVLSLGIISDICFTKTCRTVLNDVNESISLVKAGDFTSAAKKAQDAEDYWENHRKILCFTVNHGFLYEVNSRLTGLSSLSTADAAEEFLATAEQAAQSLTYVMDEK